MPAAKKHTNPSQTVGQRSKEKNAALNDGTSLPVQDANDGDSIEIAELKSNCLS